MFDDAGKEILIESAKAISTEVYKSTASSILHTLVYEKFGDRIEHTKDLEAINQKRRELLLSRSEDIMKQIPLDQLKAADSQFIYNFATAAGSCILHTEIQEMFSRLLAASFDSSKNAHPAFPNILRQMSVDDARLFAALEDEVPIVKFTIHFDDGKTEVYRDNAILSPENIKDVTSYSTSLSILAYLGLVHLEFDSQLEDFRYVPFTHSDYCSALNAELENITGAVSVGFYKGFVNLTSLGAALFKCCCLHDGDITHLAVPPTAG